MTIIVPYTHLIVVFLKNQLLQLYLERSFIHHSYLRYNKYDIFKY